LALYYDLKVFQDVYQLILRIFAENRAGLGLGASSFFIFFFRKENKERSKETKEKEVFWSYLFDHSKR